MRVSFERRLYEQLFRLHAESAVSATDLRLGSSIIRLKRGRSGIWRDPGETAPPSKQTGRVSRPTERANSRFGNLYSNRPPPYPQRFSPLISPHRDRTVAWIAAEKGIEGAKAEYVQVQREVLALFCPNV